MWTLALLSVIIVSAPAMRPASEGLVQEQWRLPYVEYLNRSIPLTQGYVAWVDNDDLERLRWFKWYAQPSSVGNRIYAFRAERRPHPTKERYYKHISMHRDILGLAESSYPFVDHWDWDGLNNLRSNLRIATRDQNAANCRRKLGANPFRGVQDDGNGIWTADACCGSQEYHCGQWSSAKAAAIARDAAVKYFHGDFGVLNFPELDTEPKSPQQLKAEAALLRKIERCTSRYRWVVRRNEYWHSNVSRTQRDPLLPGYCGSWKSEVDAAICVDSALNYVGSSAPRNFPDLIVTPHSPEELKRMANRGEKIKCEQRL